MAVLWLLMGVLAGLLVLCDGAALVGRVPTERWLVPRRTFTKQEVRTSTRTETAAASCYHIEPDLPACREARGVIEATATLPPFHDATHIPTLAPYYEPEDRFGTSEDSPPDWRRMEAGGDLQSSDAPQYGSSSINKNYKNWGFLGFNIDTTITTLKTVYETKRILDTNNIVTLTISECKPTKLTFDVPLCEEDIIIIKPTTVVDISMFSTSSLVAVNKNDGSSIVDVIIIPSEETTQAETALEVEKDDVTMATKPLVMAIPNEKVSVTKTDVETDEDMEDINANIHKDAVAGTVTQVIIVPITNDEKTGNIPDNVDKIIGSFDTSNIEITTTNYDTSNTESETQSNNDGSHIVTESKIDEPILIENPFIKVIETHMTDPIIEKKQSIVSNVNPIIVDSVTISPVFVESNDTGDQIVNDNFRQDLLMVEKHDVQIMVKPVTNFNDNIPVQFDDGVTVVKSVTVLDKLESTSDDVILAVESPSTVKVEGETLDVVTDPVSTDIKDAVEINEETPIETTEFPTKILFTEEEIVTIIPDNPNSIEQTIATVKNIVELSALKQNTHEINLQLKSTKENEEIIQDDKFQQNEDDLRKIEEKSPSSLQSDAPIKKISGIEDRVISLNEASLKQIEGLQAVFETPAVAADMGAGAVPPHVAPTAPAAADTLQPDSSRVAMPTARGA